MAEPLLTAIEVASGKVVKSLLGENALDTVKKLFFLGPREYLRARRYAKKRIENATHIPVRLAVCAIAKDESAYLDEWIRFHLAVGVEKFYIYDNGSSDKTREVLLPFEDAGYVEYKHFPGERMQLPAYQHCIQHHSQNAEWIAFIDLDEFIVPIITTNLQDILATAQSEYNQICLRWLIFGSNGHIKKPKGLVIENFTRCGGNSNLTKSIVNPRAILKVGIHEHLVIGKTLRPSLSEIRIQHYHCKSKEEYSRKATKGDVAYGQDAGALKYHDKCFREHDCNEYEDFSALRFIPLLQAVETSK